MNVQGNKGEIIIYHNQDSNIKIAKKPSWEHEAGMHSHSGAWERERVENNIQDASIVA